MMHSISQVVVFFILFTCGITVLVNLVETSPHTSKVFTIAGSGIFRDGLLKIANFNRPYGVAMDKNGDIFVSDSRNHRIRKISLSSGSVHTIAGSGESGYEDGDASVSRFVSPSGVAIDLNGDVIVADSSDCRIRKISLSTGIVSTIAGNGERGYVDGHVLIAKFSSPSDVAVDVNGDIIVADALNGRIRRISVSLGTVSTIAGGGNSTMSQFKFPLGVAIDSNRDIIVADKLDYRIKKVSTSTGVISIVAGTGHSGHADGDLSVAKFVGPSDVFVDSQGNIIVSDESGYRIRNISISNALVSTIAGNESFGFEDGPSNLAKFNNPTTITLDSHDNIIVADHSNDRIRKIDISIGVVSTVAGSGMSGIEDGEASLAKFNRPRGVVVDFDGNIIIADSGNHRIRKIGYLTGIVSTIAGSSKGFQDGHISVAKFNEPQDLVLDQNGDIIVADKSNHRIRRINLSQGTVNTIAGTQEFGFEDGPISLAKFRHPSSLAVDSKGDIIVADTMNGRIRKISLLSGMVITIAGNGKYGYEDGQASTAMFNLPSGVTTDKNDDIYVADSGNNRIRKISSGIVSTIVGGDSGFADGPIALAKFSYPQNLVIDSDGSILVADGENNRIRKLTNSSGIVSTIAGNGKKGFDDGYSFDAKFNSPSAIAIDINGDIIITDELNHRVRKIMRSVGKVSKFIGNGNFGFQDGYARNAAFKHPSGIAFHPRGYLVVADQSDHRIRKFSMFTGLVSTIAGNGEPGHRDGPHVSAMFNRPTGIAIDHHGDIIIADSSNHKIRKFTYLNNTVVTIAGGSGGFEDGHISRAKFAFPSDLCIDRNGDIIIADSGNHRIRKIRVSDGMVSTIAGNGIPGMAEGYALHAQFHTPTGVALYLNNIYVADTLNYAIRMIDVERNIVVTLSGGRYGFLDGPSTEAQFFHPTRIAIHSNGDVIVSDSGNNRIRVIKSVTSHVYTVSGSGAAGSKDGDSPLAQFNTPYGVSIDNNGDIIVADQNNHIIRKIVNYPCAIGSYSNTTFMSSVKCKYCIPGTYSDESGSTSCKLCNPGTYNPSSGNIQCYDCPAGNYSSSKGQEQCLPCEMGTFISEKGKTQCHPCPIGQYSDKPGQTYCKSCNTFYVLNEQSTSCRHILDVVLGHYITWVLSSLIIFIIIAFCICFFIVCFRLRKIRQKKEEQLELKSLLLDDTHSESVIPLDIDISLFEIDIEELTELKEIGSGGSGCLVLKAKRNNRDVVVKLFRYTSLDHSGMEQFVNELKFYMSLRDKNVVYFYGACMKPPRIGIVMEYCPNGTLKQYLKNHKLNFEQKLKLTIEIADGMSFLHANQVIHRDLKSENILIDSDFHAKIADFGISKNLGQEANTVRVGTGVYMAPEVTLGKTYNEKCDVFSFAIIMYEILTENSSPYGTNADHVEFRVANNPTFRPIIPDNISIDGKVEKYVVLMTNCWTHDPASRPSFQEISSTLG